MFGKDRHINIPAKKSLYKLTVKLMNNLVHRIWLQRVVWASFLAGVIFLGDMFVWTGTASSDTLLESVPDQSSQLFEIHCAGCHLNGGNIIRRGKTLKTKALKRYGYDNVAAVSTIITNGKGVMSAYADRLTPAEIEALATYVLEQAAQGW
jgi:cytochrome c6